MARIEGAVVNQAHAVGTDAAHVVCGGFAIEGHGDIRVARDAAHLLALFSECRGRRCHVVVVAVGEVTFFIARDEDAGAVLTDIQCERGGAVEAVGEVDHCTRLGEAHHAAARSGGEGESHRAMEGAAGHVERGAAADTAHEAAAVHPVVGFCGRHGHGAPAVADGAVAFNEGGKGGGAVSRSGYGALYFQVFEGRPLNQVEESSAWAVTRKGEGDGVSVAVEGTTEGVAIGACHRRYGGRDVGGQGHGLSAVRRSVVHRRRKSVPFRCRADVIRSCEGHHHVVIDMPACSEGRSQGFVGHIRGICAFVFKYRGLCHIVVVTVAEGAAYVARDKDVRIVGTECQYECGRAIEAIGEVDCCTRLGEAHHAAARIGGGVVGHRAVEGAVGHVERVVAADTGHEAAAVHPAVGLCGRHGHGAPAVADGAVAENEGCEGGGAVFIGGDGALRFQVLEGRAFDVGEEGRALAATRQGEGDGVSVAVEGAAESMVVGFAGVRARHGGGGDVGGEFHGLARVGRVVGDTLREGVPVRVAADQIRVVGRARARQSLRLGLPDDQEGEEEDG